MFGRKRDWDVRTQSGKRLVSRRYQALEECTNVVGCGVKLNEGNHASTGTNVATCQHKAVCDVCSEMYGELGGHNWAPATCTALRICTVCGVTEGTAPENTTKSENSNNMGTTVSSKKKKAK